MSIGGLLGLFLETQVLKMCMNIMAIIIFVITFGRMIEIYLTISVAPIPFSTMMNREWGQIGNGYLKTLFALAFQGFLIMVCVAIFAVLVWMIPFTPNIHVAIWVIAGYCALLCFMLLKSGGLARAIFNAA